MSGLAVASASSQQIDRVQNQKLERAPKEEKVEESKEESKEEVKLANSENKGSRPLPEGSTFQAEA